MMFSISNSNIQRITASFLAFNLLILVGARALSYYNSPVKVTDLLFSTVSEINFVIAIFFYVWMSRMDGMKQEAQMHKKNLHSVEEALQIMRRERHDFLNHLQAIYGLVSGGNNKEATVYLKNMGADCQFNNQLLNIKNPYLTSLLQNKKRELSLKGIDFNITVKSKLIYFDINPPLIITIFGNLIDNARDALLSAEGNIAKAICFEIHELDDNYCFVISDTAPPINKDIINRIFENGFSTKGNDRGYGLALVKDALTMYHGRIAYDHSTKTFNVIIPKFFGVKEQ